MLNRVKIPLRLALLGGIPMTGLVLVLLLSFQISSSKDRLFDRLYQDHLLVLNDILLVQRLVQTSALNEIRLYRTGWASADNTTASVNAILEQASQHWLAYQQARTDANSELNQQADREFADALALYQDWLQPVGSDALNIRILNDSTVNHEVSEQLGRYDQTLNQLIQHQLDAAAQVQEEASVLTSTLAQGYVYGGSLLVLGSLLLAWRIQRSIQRPLQELRNLILAIEQEADLRLRAKPIGNDEVAQTAAALNTLLNHFQQLIHSLEQSAGRLSGHAARAQTISEQVSLSSQQQNTEAGRMKLSINEMSLAIHEVAQRSSDAASLANQADNLCQAGVQQVGDSMHTIENLARHIGSTSDIITALHSHSSNISGVLEVIQSVAEQINLLALNAAIEAARAGPAGRGFAVVADEVRNLSRSTAASITSIQTLVEQLQAQAGLATQAMLEAREQAQNSVDFAIGSNQTLQNIRGAVQEISRLNSSISVATEQQQAAVSGNLAGIEALNLSVSQLDQDAGESLRISQELAGLASSLRSHVRQYHTHMEPVAHHVA